MSSSDLDIVYEREGKEDRKEEGREGGSKEKRKKGPTRLSHFL
jgi:hypothetical protein